MSMSMNMNMNMSMISIIMCCTNAHEVTGLRPRLDEVAENAYDDDLQVPQTAPPNCLIYIYIYIYIYMYIHIVCDVYM